VSAVTEIRVPGRQIAVAALAILIAALMLSAAVFGALAFQEGRELRTTVIALRQAEARADTAERAFLQCDARRQQFEELLGLTAWRKRERLGIGPTGGAE